MTLVGMSFPKFHIIVPIMFRMYDSDLVLLQEVFL